MALLYISNFEHATIYSVLAGDTGSDVAMHSTFTSHGPTVVSAQGIVVNDCDRSFTPYVDSHHTASQNKCHVSKAFFDSMWDALRQNTILQRSRCLFFFYF